jgi:hypothetical protein
MDKGRAGQWVFGAWVAMVAIISIRHITGSRQGMPPPGQYLGSGIAFTMLWLLSMPAPSLAVALAVGLDVGALIAPYIKGQPGVLDTTAAWLAGISGSPTTGK